MGGGRSGRGGGGGSSRQQRAEKSEVSREERPQVRGQYSGNQQSRKEEENKGVHVHVEIFFPTQFQH